MSATNFAKILCTIGPASSSPAVLGAMMDAGMDAARVNFSHGDHEVNGKLIDTIREVAKKKGRHLPILLDLQGPKIRTGKFETGSTNLEEGSTFIITSEDIAGTDEMVSTTYKQLPQDVRKGSILFLDDGNLKLEVEDSDGTRITCRVLEGGLLKNNKGINLVGASISLPALTEKDRIDLEFGCKKKVEYVALSFVRSHADILEGKMLLASHGLDAELIAKIERPEALNDIARILEEADGIMIARGDLGVELPPEEVPPHQKRLIRAANEQGKLVITATQMLESMMERRRPSRAEASDVANAVFDGSSALMLSGETAAGQNPVETVRTMRSIIERAESAPLWSRERKPFDHPSKDDIPFAVAQAAAGLADVLDIAYIIVFTNSGFSARLISRFRPRVKILAFSHDAYIVRQLSLHWGIESLTCDTFETTEQLIDYLEYYLLQSGITFPGQRILVLGGSPVGQGTKTNLLKIHEMAGRS